MPKQIQRMSYDFLISCPSDIAEIVDTIKLEINEFNDNYGKENNIEINPVYWQDNVYPQSGDRAQNIINKQIVDESDAIIAIFWTRFGSPTDKYLSGTEEEIEKMIENGKQVFLYFCNKDANVSLVDFEQYKKITIFKEKYKAKGIYFDFKSNEELKKLIHNHLKLFFKEKYVSTTLTNMDYLLINGVLNNKPLETLNFIQYNAQNSKSMTKKLQEIKNQYSEIFSFPELKGKEKSWMYLLILRFLYLFHNLTEAHRYKFSVMN